MTRSKPFRAPARRSFQVAAVASVVCLLVTATASAQLPVPQLNTIFPAGGKVGSSFDVTIAGANLEETGQLVFSHPGITSQPKTQTGEFEKTPRPIDNSFSVTIAGDVPPGVYEVRTVGRFGSSNSRAFAVGRFDEILDDGSNSSLAAAKEIPVPSTVNGQVGGGAIEYFKLNLKQGQRVLIDAWGQRIDSRLDATLVIYNAAGGEIARNRDSEGTDALLDFTAPVDGAYIVGLYDFLYRGGAEYFFRLTVHSDPQVDFVFPPAGVPGSNGQYTVYGRNLPGGQPAPNMTIEGQPLQMVTAAIALPADDAARFAVQPGTFLPPQGALLDGIEYRLSNSSPVRLGFAFANVIAEQEPNNDPAAATKVAVPCEVAGQFYPARDVDWIQFDAKKGEVYQLDVISHRLGLETDPCLLLQKVNKDANGVETAADIAAVDDPGDRAGRIGGDYDTSTDDPSYRFAVGEDGTYRVMVRDQFGDARSDARILYRLVIRAEQPDFRLVAAVEPNRPGQPNAAAVFIDPLVLQRGGTAVLKAIVERRDGFAGEVDVQVEGLPAGVTCPGALIGTNGNTAMLVLTATEDAAAWQGSIRVVGKSKIGGQDVSRVARPVTSPWGTANRQQEAPSFRAAREIALSVTDKLKAPATVAIGDGNVIETSLGATVEVPVKVTRRDGFNAELKLVSIGTPNEIKPADVTIKGDAGDGKVAIALTNAAAKADAYTFFFRIDTKSKLELNPESARIAEEQLKEIDEAIKALDEEVKVADTAKNDATKAATDAAEALKTAQAGTDQAAITDAQTKLNAAQEAQKAADQKLKDLQEKQKRGAPAKQAIEKKIVDLKKNNAAKDVNFAIVSTPVRLRVAKSPFKFAAETANVAIKVGQKAELPLALQKLYGFDDNIEITLEPPQGSKGLSAPKITINKGAADGKLEINIGADATPGDYTATVRGKAKFNNVNVEATSSVVIKVEAAS